VARAGRHMRSRAGDDQSTLLARRRRVALPGGWSCGLLLCLARCRRRRAGSAPVHRSFDGGACDQSVRDRRAGEADL
jgi:hypothetical protein